jgi:hypothetical protein
VTLPAYSWRATFRGDDTRCSLFVFEQGGYAWLALETTVSILQGPDAPTQSLQLFRW